MARYFKTGVSSQRYFWLIEFRFCHVASCVSRLQNRVRKFFWCQFRGYSHVRLVRRCYATRDLLLCNVGDVVTRQMIHKRYKRANCGACREIELCLNCVSCAWREYNIYNVNVRYALRARDVETFLPGQCGSKIVLNRGNLQYFRLGETYSINALVLLRSFLR